MFGWMGKLFGTDKAASSLIDNISSGLDKLHYSDQEKAEDRAQAVKEGNQVYMEWLKSTSGSRLARRYIAIVVTTVWVLQYIVALVLGASTPWITDQTTVEAIHSTIESIKDNGSQMDGAASLILAFYFLGNKADALVEVAVDKMKGNNSSSSKK
tara:strand:+ start:1378 stop:1842 length:465 start_codon:yes stop_codon:yes gene_type:complete